MIPLNDMTENDFWSECRRMWTDVVAWWLETRENIDDLKIRWLDENDYIMESNEMAEGGRVSKFDKLANAVAAQYRKKGFSDKKAQEIGDGTAAKVYREQQAKKS